MVEWLIGILPTADCQLPTANCLLPTSCHLVDWYFVTANCQLPTANLYLIDWLDRKQDGCVF